MKRITAILIAMSCLGLAHGCTRDEPPAITEAQNLSGVWWTERYDARIQLVGGGDLPFTDEGRTRAAANAAMLAADPLSDEARKFCLPDGVPRILGNPYPFQIIQTPGWVTIVYELNRVVRRVEMDATQREGEWLELFPYYSGHSVGRWDGDALVIETAGYNDKTFLDSAGAPHSDTMKTVERVRKVANDQLEIVVTITDPATYSAPLEARYTYKLHSGLRLEDYNCGEPHRDIAHVPGVVAPAPATTPAQAQSTAPATTPALGQPAAPLPDFDGLWTAGGFEPPATGRGGMTMHPDPAYRYRGTREDDRSRQNTIPPIADLTDPLLKPWAVDVLRPIVTRRIAGEIIPEARSQCLPMGTPMLLVEGGPRLFLQEENQITIVHEELPEVRRIYLNVPHSENPTPSWYGESVGHFEGDTLVVDTIGISDKTWVDDFLTPHTANMHVVERYKKLDANTIQIEFTVEDPDTFNENWGGRVTWTRAAANTKFQEVRCSEYNFDVVTGATLPMPVATTLDF